MQMLWRNNEDHKNDDTAITQVNVSPIQGDKGGGRLGYVIESATHLIFTKMTLASRVVPLAQNWGKIAQKP
jgi:hypothetical protein